MLKLAQLLASNTVHLSKQAISIKFLFSAKEYKTTLNAHFRCISPYQINSIGQLGGH